MSDVYVKKNFLVGASSGVDAVSGNDYVRLSQVQSILDGRTFMYDSVRLVSGANIDVSSAGLGILDGVQIADGDRILLTGQTDPIENGIYIASAGAWSRAADMDTGDTAKAYAHVYVREGNTQANHEFAIQSTTPNLTVGTDGITWIHAHSFTNDAAAIDTDDSSFTRITGTNAQAAFDSIDDQLIIDSQRVDTLVGVTGNNLGSFTGSTIPANASVKSAMQALENAVENVPSNAATTSYDDTGNTVVTGSTVQAALDKAEEGFGVVSTHVDAITGVAADHLGTFPGSTIRDSADIKEALTDLESGIEGIDVSGQVETYYDNQKSVTSGVTLSANAWTTVTHNLNDAYPSKITLYNADGEDVTENFHRKTSGANAVEIENEHTVALPNITVVVRA